MATIPASLYVRYKPGDPLDSSHNRLLFNQSGGTPSMPPFNAGDQINFSVFFLDDGSGVFPFRGHRYAGSTVVVRLRAQGNNHIYATATGSEIAPATGTTITRTQIGGSFQTEKQSVAFNSAIFTGGTFKISFSGAGTSGRGGGISLEGTTVPIRVFTNAYFIEQYIREIRGFYKGNDGPYTHQELASRYGIQAPPPTVTDTPTGFVVEFGSLVGGSSYWNTGIHLLTVDDSDLEYAFGWEADVPLTAGDFTNLFLTANAPAYLEVLLDGVIAAQQIITGSGAGGGPPPPPPGGGGPPDNVAGIIYDGDHFSAAWPVGVLRSETAFAERPGYMIFKQRHRMARSRYADLPLDTPCPGDANAFLVEETERQDVGGAELQEWDRIWAHVPPQIVDGEMVDYVWQTTGTIGGALAIQSIPLTRWAKRTRTFYHTADPATIPKSRLPRAGVFAGVGLLFDGFVNLSTGTTTIARDDDVRRWMGNIWVKTHWDITI